MLEEIKKLPQFTTKIAKKGGAITLTLYIPTSYLRKIIESEE